MTIEPGGNLLRPTDPTRLPPDKLGRWMFTALSWNDMTEEQRLRWREWFDWATSPAGDLYDQRAPGAVLRGARLDHADLAGADLTHADLSGASMRGTNLAGAELHRARFSRAHLEEAVLQRADLSEANFTDAHIGGADLLGADLSGALMHDMDLTDVDFKDARLFGTKVTDPVWWVEMPRATLSGRTVFPSQLPEHPIQDVLGLPPLLRRQLADAQYLRDMYRKSRPFGRSLMWLWGVTCCYGQSFSRWAMCTALLLVTFSLIYTFFPFYFTVSAVEKHVAIPMVHDPTFWQGMYFSLSTMTTLGLGDVVPADTAGRAIVSVQEVFGYLMLGGLLSIFANKLARLS